MTPRRTTTQRGYGAAHQNLRAQWKPHVDAGLVDCHAAICLKPARRITPGEPWHLGHNPQRTAWTGPEHEQCNESDGARRKNRKSRTVTATAGPLRTSRAW